MREIVFDTETTGLDPSEGHRVVEIGCVEIFNHVPTGRTWHSYLNPERPMPAEAAQVHGLKDDFLAQQPLFSEIVTSFLEFIEEAPLVAHNASFDLGFINAELKRHGFATLAKDRAIDTVVLARRLFPGSPASLDALCRRFGVDLSGRQLHGALLDALLLAEVYLELKGGRQPVLAMVRLSDKQDGQDLDMVIKREHLAARPHTASEAELAAHESFLALIKDPLWKLA